MATAVFCAAASAVMLPKRYDYGATWSMYEREPENSVQVMFFGSSLVYCDVIPAVIYEESGVASYVMAGPEQTYPITYRYLLESGKSQRPEVVFIEATGMLYADHYRSTKINLTYMPWGLNRVIPTLQETSGEEQTGLLFPLYAYHDRWDTLTDKDCREGLFGYGPDLLAGYTFLDGVKPIEEVKIREFQEYPETYEGNLEYAKKMVEYCEKNGIRPIFYLAPNVNRPSEERTEKLRGDLESVGGEFLDCNEDFEEMFLELSVDFFDTLHFNYRGAEKFSAYLAKMLEEMGVEPKASGQEELWRERVDEFARLRDKADDAPIKLSGATDSPT